MGVYASMYEENDKKRGSNEYVKTFEEISVDKNVFENFIDITSQKFNLSMMENGTWGEDIITEKYNNKNRENLTNFLNQSNNNDVINLRDKMAIYEKMSYIEYNEIKQNLKNATISDVENKSKHNDYYKKIEAVRDIESFIQANPQSKIMTKDNIIQNARKDVDLERRKFDARYNAQSSVVGSLIGDMGAALTDPINIATLFVPQATAVKGASALSKAFNIAKTTAVVEMGAEAINQITATMPYRKEVLGDEYTTLDAAGAVITTGGGAFLLGGSLSLLADGGKYLLKQKNNKSVNDIIKDESIKQYSENPEKFDADLIDSMHNVINNSDKVDILKDQEFIQEHFNSIDKAAFDLSFGKKVDIKSTTKNMRTKAFNKVLNNFDSKTNLDKFKLAFGEEAFNYIKKNTSDIRKLVNEKGIDEAFNDIDLKIKSQEKFESSNVKASEGRSIPNFEKKVNNELLKDGYSKEVLDELNRNLNEIDRMVGELEGIEEVKELVNDVKKGIIDSRDNINKLSKEQENLENFIGCIIGAK